MWVSGWQWVGRIERNKEKRKSMKRAIDKIRPARKQAQNARRKAERHKRDKESIENAGAQDVSSHEESTSCARETGTDV